MTPEEPRRGSLCCGFPAIRQHIWLHRPGQRPVAIGRVPKCGKCLKACGQMIAFKTTDSSDGLECEPCPQLDSSAFLRLQRWSSEYGRYNAKINDLGVLVPFGWTEDSRADFKKAAIPDDEVPF